MPRGNPSHDGQGSHPGGSAAGRRRVTGVETIHIENIEDLAGGVAPSDPAEAVAQGIHTGWPTFVLPLGVFVNQLLTLESDGNYTQPDLSMQAFRRSDKLYWNGTIWVLMPLAGIPPSDLLDAYSKGFAVVWDDTDLPTGVFDGQVILAGIQGGATYTQPGGVTIVINAGTTIIWNVTLNIWVIGECCGDAPPVDEPDSVTKGRTTAWPVTGSGQTLPDGYTDGQVIMPTGGGSHFQPDGVTPVEVTKGSQMAWNGGTQTWDEITCTGIAMSATDAVGRTTAASWTGLDGTTVPAGESAEQLLFCPVAASLFQPDGVTELNVKAGDYLVWDGLVWQTQSTASSNTEQIAELWSALAEQSLKWVQSNAVVKTWTPVIGDPPVYEDLVTGDLGYAETPAGTDWSVLAPPSSGEMTFNGPADTKATALYTVVADVKLLRNGSPNLNGVCELAVILLHTPIATGVPVVVRAVTVLGTGEYVATATLIWTGTMQPGDKLRLQTAAPIVQVSVGGTWTVTTQATSTTFEALSSIGASGTNLLPASDYLDAISKGLNIVWPVASPVAVPDGVLPGQRVSISVANTAYTGTGGPWNLGIGDWLVWSGAAWLAIDMATQSDLDLFSAALLAKADNLASVASAATSRTNLDVYSKAEVDAIHAGAPAKALLTRVPSMHQDLQMTAQAGQYWTSDPGTKGAVNLHSAGPGPGVGGGVWNKVLADVTEWAQLYLTANGVGARRLPERGTNSIPGARWVVYAWRAQVDTEGSLHFIGVGNGFASQLAPTTYLRCWYNGSNWQLTFMEPGETETSSDFTGVAAPTATTAFWCFMRLSDDGRVRGLIMEQDGTETLCPEIAAPTWWSSRANIIYAPFLSGFQGTELLGTKFLCWDSETLCDGTEPF